MLHLPCQSVQAHCVRERCGRQTQLGNGRHCGPHLVLRFPSGRLSTRGMAHAGAGIVGHLRAAQAGLPTGLGRGLGSLPQLALVAALYSRVAGEHCGLVGVERLLLILSGTMGGVLLASISRRSREADQRGDSRTSV